MRKVSWQIVSSNLMVVTLVELLCNYPSGSKQAPKAFPIKKLDILHGNGQKSI